MRVIIASLLALAFTTAVAGDYEDGLAAYERRDYATAFAKWHRAAQQGFFGAQYSLGVMYYEGKGVAQDYKEAVHWYKLAAQQGDHFAQFNLGSMYEKGQGVARDYKEALRLYKLAAKQNDKKAQVELGAIYYLGKGVLQDYARAHMWFNIAAADGDSEGAKYRDELTRMLTAQQVELAQRMARECMNSNFTKCD